MPAWEIGRARSGLGAKVGGLGVIVEELPPELVKAAAKQGITLEIEILSPCFAHYDKSQLTDTGICVPVMLDGHTFDFSVFEHVFPDGQKVVYFWDEWQLGWTNAAAIYPDDPEMAFKLYATVSQAMAGYIRQGNFHTVHSHDYHVGLVPFYLGDEFLARVPHHFTIHNATYQGRFSTGGRGYELLESINLSGEQLFHKYFDHFDCLNFMKAAMLKTHETGGKITTVSGDSAGTWGYAAELRMSRDDLWAAALAQKGGAPVGDVFVPNQGLDVFEKLPVAGITNGLSERNRPENLAELKASVLREMQSRQKYGRPLFDNPIVQHELLNRSHSFDGESLHVKSELKRLLHLEVFGSDPVQDPILITAVGRLVAQKNLGLAADIIERALAHDENTKFVILASAPQGDPEGKATETAFFALAERFPDRVYFNNTFNLPLSRLILAGGDFTLVPSRFEPCGLVDYEAALLGTIPIARLTGGLGKIAHCGYLYEWLDISDREGEAAAFLQKVKEAIDVYRQNPARHYELVNAAVATDASWDKSAGQYVQLYRYGLVMKDWFAARGRLVKRFARSAKKALPQFAEFFIPAEAPYGDTFNWELRRALEK